MQIRSGRTPASIRPSNAPHSNLMQVVTKQLLVMLCLQINIFQVRSQNIEKITLTKPRRSSTSHTNNPQAKGPVERMTLFILIEKL